MRLPTTPLRALSALALTVTLVAGSAATSAAAAPPVAPASSAASTPASGALTSQFAVSATSGTTPEQRVTAFINQKRAAAGLPKLKVTASLRSAAETWAKHLATNGIFKHSTSTWRMAKIGTATWRSSGENIAAGYPTASSVMRAWMNSSGHRANILGKSYRGVGVGYVHGGPYGHYWVVIFAVPK
ncbi:CAP domain-containing protein [Microbacterium terricola]|uniref:SCP domain-containing protein n=1 Tax=Microbacterium terricola TaxID=344163 RepID=A0ABM8E0I0_9MICO|nr:CAP domain-containing protein [Microbacterium terricola]UYK40946.1 CAP domain-containing protein [Microbacterium terricola]BDV31302.1 hypothetical protein Microterr_19620 [Microbacterium terricola]